jgi:hypothetical protein
MAKTITPAAKAQQNYQSGVQGAAASWAQGIQGYNGESPMNLAAAQAAKAAANYAAVINNSGPDGWVAKLQATPVSYWKSQAAAGQAKYSMAKGANKWSKWYSSTGIQMAQAMSASAAADKAQGVGGIQRAVNALTVAQSMGRKG